MTTFFQLGECSDIRYSTCRDNLQHSALKNWIENAWKSYETYCGDGAGKFINDAKNNFCGQVWHLYLADLFTRNGFKLLRTGPGQPDICIDLNGRKLWIEAVSVTVGNEPNKVPGYEYYFQIDGFFQPPDSKIQMRLSSAFITKKSQIDKYVNSGLVAQSDLCLIAVNSGDVPMSGITADFSNMFKVLYKVKGECLSVNKATHQSQTVPIRGDLLTKASGETFQVGYFENPEFRRIDGVIYCSEDVFRLDGNVADNIQLIPNSINGDMIPESVFNCFGDKYRVENFGLIRERAS